MSKFTNPFPQHFLSTGAPAAFYVVYFGEPNTDPVTNPKAPFSDAGFTTPITTTQILDAKGSYGSDIFLNGQYSIKIETPTGTLWRESPVISGVFDIETAGSITINFNNFADFVSGTLPNGNPITLSVGQYAGILGRVTAGDGGDNTYLIGTFGVADLGSIVDLDSGLQGKGLFPGGNVNLAQFGATTADSQIAINACLAYASTNNVRQVYNYSTVGIGGPVNAVSNVTFYNQGTIVINGPILAASNLGAIVCDTKSRFKFIGGTVDASGVPTYDNNIFLFQDNDKCLIRNVDIIDADNDRYPLGPLRTQQNTNSRFEYIDMSNVGGIGHQSFEDDDCHFIAITGDGEDGTSQRSMIETNDGEQNIWALCRALTPSNTTTSSFSFNDKKSVLIGNITVGGGEGISVGHLSPFEADLSTVLGNVVDSPTTNCFNVQATMNAAMTGNVLIGGTNGMAGTSGSQRCVATGNVLFGQSSIGISAGDYWVVTGNCSDGATSASYRTAFDSAHVVVTGNMSVDCDNTGYQWGLAISQINAVVVGNMACDSRGTPLLTTGFNGLSPQNLFLGNATDGNATFRQFDGNFSTLPNKDLSDATEDSGLFSDGTTGGAASAGVGNQHVTVDVDGIVYKLLHDGTV